MRARTLKAKIKKLETRLSIPIKTREQITSQYSQELAKLNDSFSNLQQKLEKEYKENLSIISDTLAKSISKLQKITNEKLELCDNQIRKQEDLIIELNSYKKELSDLITKKEGRQRSKLLDKQLAKNPIIKLKE